MKLLKYEFSCVGYMSHYGHTNVLYLVLWRCTHYMCFEYVLFFNIIKCYIPFTFCVYVRDVTFVCSLYSSCCPCYWYTSQLRIILSWHTPSRSYKQSINVVYGHNHCLFWDAQKHISTLNGQNVYIYFFTLGLMVHVATITLKRF